MDGGSPFILWPWCSAHLGWNRALISFFFEISSFLTPRVVLMTGAKPTSTSQPPGPEVGQDEAGSISDYSNIFLNCLWFFFWFWTRNKSQVAIGSDVKPQESHIQTLPYQALVKFLWVLFSTSSWPWVSFWLWLAQPSFGKNPTKPSSYHFTLSHCKLIKDLLSSSMNKSLICL